MTKRNKLFSCILVSAAIVVQGVVALAANSSFTDMPSGDIGTALEKAVANGLIFGYEDNTVRPDENITRAQMSAIIVRAMGATDTSSTIFNDITSDALYADSVSKAVAINAFKGDTNGNFNPENNITFQETYIVLARVLGFEPYRVGSEKDGYRYIGAPEDNALDTFSDKSEISDWAVDDTRDVVGNGGWKGFNGLLKPTSSITRGEFAYLMNVLVSDYVDEAGEKDYSGITPAGAVMIRIGGVTVKNLSTTKNVIVSYAVDAQGAKFTDCDIQSTLLILGGDEAVEKTDETTGVTTTVAAPTAHITISGKYKDVRITVPYVYLDASAENAEIFKNLYVVKNSSAYMGTLSGGTSDETNKKINDDLANGTKSGT